jgi:hypothetical protein
MHCATADVLVPLIEAQANGLIRADDLDPADRQAVSGVSCS